MDRRERAAAGAGRATGGGQVVEKTLHSGDGQQVGAKRDAAGAGGQPSNQVAQGRQVGGDGFGIAIGQVGGKGDQGRGIGLADGHRRPPGSGKGFSAEFGTTTRGGSIPQSAELRMGWGMGGTYELL